MTGSATTGNPMPDRELRAWLAAQEQPAQYLDDVMAAVGATRQRAPRRGWLRLPELEPFRGRPLVLPIAGSLLLAALLGAVLVIGAILRERPPLSLAPPTMEAFRIAERSNSAWVGVPLEVEVQFGGTAAGEHGRIRFFADGLGRYRVEHRSPTEDVRYVYLVGDGYWYTRETGSDGIARWWSEVGQARSGVPPFSDPNRYREPYPLSAPYPCPGGWAYVDTVLILGRVADHLRCDAPWLRDVPTGGPEAWIDRETFLVLRTSVGVAFDQGLGDVHPEVVAIRFHRPAAELFELPAGAEPRTRP